MSDPPRARDSLAPRAAALPRPVAHLLDEITDHAAEVLAEQAPELTPERIAALAPKIAERCTRAGGTLYVAGVQVGAVGAPAGPLIAQVVAAWLDALAALVGRARAPVPTVEEVADQLAAQGVLGVDGVAIASACRAAHLPLSSLPAEEEEA